MENLFGRGLNSGDTTTPQNGQKAFNEPITHILVPLQPGTDADSTLPVPVSARVFRRFQRLYPKRRPQDDVKTLPPDPSTTLSVS